MSATLEERFADALGRWKKHCLETIHHSYSEPSLNCDAYREIVSMGTNSLPLIRTQLNQEIETDKRYDNELKRLKIKVFGTEQIELYRETYWKILEDEEYQTYQKGYSSEIMGSPGQLWSYAVHDIVGDDFRIKLSGDSPVQPKGCFVAIDVKGVMQFTLNWLDENMHKYSPLQQL